MTDDTNITFFKKLPISLHIDIEFKKGVVNNEYK